MRTAEEIKSKMIEMRNEFFEDKNLFYPDDIVCFLNEVIKWIDPSEESVRINESKNRKNENHEEKITIDTDLLYSIIDDVNKMYHRLNLFERELDNIYTCIERMIYNKGDGRRGINRYNYKGI